MLFGGYIMINKLIYILIFICIPVKIIREVILIFKKCIINNILFYLYFLLSSITVVIFTYNQRQFKLSNYFISDKSINFQVDNIDLKEMYEVDAFDFMIFNKYNETEEMFSIFGIFFKGDNELPKLIEGRFFKETDF